MTSFVDTLLGLFLCFVFINLWIIYFTHINAITTPVTLSTDLKRPKAVETIRNLYVVILGLLIMVLNIINYMIISNYNTQSLYWDMLYLSNNGVSYFFFSITILLAILFVSISLFNQNVVFTSEYLFFIVIITISSYLLISSTNLFLAIFILEFIALLIFGKFAVSRVLYNNNPIRKSNSTLTPQFSYGLFNSLFFQFWANFVSSVFLFFSLINLHYLFGFSNFFFLNFFFSVLSYNWYSIEFFNSFILIILTTGFFIKLGLSPYQFFKIETYKGIPLFMVIIYTTLYLVIYIYFFALLFLYQLPMLKDFTSMYITITVALSIFYLVNLLFDTKNFKAFLSYSTLVTVVNLFVIILVI